MEERDAAATTVLGQARGEEDVCGGACVHAEVTLGLWAAL